MVKGLGKKRNAAQASPQEGAAEVVPEGKAPKAPKAKNLKSDGTNLSIVSSESN